jgi:hypothetical protein
MRSGLYNYLLLEVSAAVFLEDFITEKAAYADYALDFRA